MRHSTQKRYKSLQYQFRDRKNKKRYFRSNFIQRLNAALRKYNLNYSITISRLLKTEIIINRKLLSILGLSEPKSFNALIHIL